MNTWTREAIEQLGPTTDVPTAASVLDISDWTAYDLIRRGEWTATRVLRLGRRIRIPVHDLISLLYGANPAVPSPCHHAVSTQVNGPVPHAVCGCTGAPDAS